MQLLQGVNQNLTAANSDLMCELEAIASNFGTSLALARSIETQLSASIAAQKLAITQERSAKGNERQVVVFGDRMREFQHILDESEASLQQMWKEWSAVQIEIMGIAVEVLGPAALMVDQGNLATGLEEQLQSAVQVNAEDARARNTNQARLQDIERSCQQLCSTTLVETQELQKVRNIPHLAVTQRHLTWLQEWRLSRKRLLDEVQKAVSQLEKEC